MATEIQERHRTESKANQEDQNSEEPLVSCKLVIVHDAQNSLPHYGMIMDIHCLNNLIVIDTSAALIMGSNYI